MMKYKISARAFTLIELLVVLVIMSLITLAFLNNQSKFDSSTIMRSLAYSVALSIRQAQVYGTSSVRSNGSSFSVSHGVYFVPQVNTPSTYVLFGDVYADHQYTPGPDSIDKSFTINSEYHITEVCARASSGLLRCTGADDSSGVGTITQIDILFTRPNLDAQIYAFYGTQPITPAEVYSTGYIKISSINGDFRFITVTNTGQVTVCGPSVGIGSMC